MAPEQAAGKPVDARADIYSLGLVMFAMLTGKPPFRAGHYTEVMRMQQTTPPPRLTTLLPDLPEPVDRLIQKMLAKNPAERPASALALGRLLEAVEGAITAELAAARPVVVEPAPDANNTAPSVSANDATLEVTTDQPVAHADAHLLAPTQGATAPPPAADPTKRDGGTKQPTEANAANTQVGPVRRSRHVSVEREKVIAAAREKRAHHRDLWVQAASVAGLSAVLIVGAYLLLRPLTADDLRARIDETVAAASERLDGLKDAEREIDEFLARYPADPLADDVRGMKRQILVDRLEKRAALRNRRDKPPYLRIERDYREALEPDDANEQLSRLRAILVADSKALATPVGLPADEDDLQADLDLWKALIATKIEQVERLASADRRAQQLDATRRKP
jgi:serine/threonine-protein kinase